MMTRIILAAAAFAVGAVAVLLAVAVGVVLGAGVADRNLIGA